MAERRHKDFEVAADEVMSMQDVVHQLVSGWVDELREEGMRVLSSNIELHVVDKPDKLDPRYVKFRASLEVEKMPALSHIRWLGSKNPMCEYPMSEDFVMHALGDNPCRRCSDVLQWRFKAGT